MPLALLVTAALYAFKLWVRPDTPWYIVFAFLAAYLLSRFIQWAVKRFTSPSP